MKNELCAALQIAVHTPRDSANQEHSPKAEFIYYLDQIYPQIQQSLMGRQIFTIEECQIIYNQLKSEQKEYQATYDALFKHSYKIINSPEKDRTKSELLNFIIEFLQACSQNEHFRPAIRTLWTMARLPTNNI